MPKKYIKEISRIHGEKKSKIRVCIVQLNLSLNDFIKIENTVLYTHKDPDKIYDIVLQVLDNIIKRNDEYNCRENITTNSPIDLVVFPEFSIPNEVLSNLHTWLKVNLNDTIIIAGSHYELINDNYISRCPIIFNNKVYFTHKINPSTLEDTCDNLGKLSPGNQILKFSNTSIGRFTVLICSDFIEFWSSFASHSKEWGELDLLIVPACNDKNGQFFQYMSSIVASSTKGIFIIYSNLLCSNHGLGESGVFGHIDNKLQTNNDYPNCAHQLVKNSCNSYAIYELDLENKKPTIGAVKKKNISTIVTNNIVNTSSDYYTSIVTQKPSSISKKSPPLLLCCDIDNTIIKYPFDNKNQREVIYSWVHLFLKLGIDMKAHDNLKDEYMITQSQEAYNTWCEKVAKLFKTYGFNNDKSYLTQKLNTCKLITNFSKGIKYLQENDIKLALISGGIDTILFHLIPDAKNIFTAGIFINKATFNKDSFLTSFIPTRYDFINKAQALKLIAKQHNIPLTNTAFFGDGVNDHEALRAAKYKYAIPNSNISDIACTCYDDFLLLATDLVSKSCSR